MIDNVKDGIFFKRDIENEEMDRGKMKKVKNKRTHDDSKNNVNHFQSFYEHKRQ
eukprot:Pgem_evm1s10396